MTRHAIMLVGLCACADAINTDTAYQDVVSGVSTIIQPPSALPMNQVGVLDTGPEPIVDGSVWLSASISLHCSSSGFATACGREFDPAAPSTATTWCTPITACSGDTTYTIPMTAFTADAHHALGLSVMRSATTITVNNATLTVLGFGP